MEPKKNPKADVSRNGSVYFAVGLALMLFVTYSTINYKTYDKEAIDIGMVNMDELDDEEIPITEQIQTPPPPPPPPAAHEVSDSVEDEEEIEDTVIESTETSENEEIVKIEDGKRIDFKIRFEEPFELEDDAYIITESIGDNKTKVTWGIKGKKAYPTNLFLFFIDIEGMIGPDLDGGLKNLKKVLEKKYLK